MKKSITFFILLFSVNLIFSQIIDFKQLTQPFPANQNTTEFMGVSNGSIDFLDFNNDNKMDILISGDGNYEKIVTDLYKNTGNGVFEKVINTPFVKVRRAITAIGDINNDGFEDIFIVGADSLNQMRLDLYYNINGVFIKDTTNYTGYTSGTLFLIDIDNDNDLDLFNSGRTYNGGHSVLYLNNGSGIFTPSTNTPFGNFNYGGFKVFDADGDSNMDVIFTGMENSTYTTKLYINNGNNGFSLSSQQFSVISPNTLETCDIDNDNDEDLIITSSIGGSFLFRNNGSGLFSMDSSFSIKHATYYLVKAVDWDGDNDNDLIFNGKDSLDNRLIDIYLNNGSGAFTLSPQNNIYPIYISDIDFADIDNDNDLDFMFIGFHEMHDNFTRLFINHGSGNYKAATGSQFYGVNNSDADFADIDNDNDLDIIITGNNVHSYVNQPDWYGITTIYKNMGNNIFTPVTGTPFDSIVRGSVKFADVNNDNLPDLFFCGHKRNYRQSNLYINTGNGNFALKTDTTFTPVDYSSVDFADIDNDNDLDMVLSGLTHNSYPYLDILKLYKNDGSGNFSEILNTNLPQYRFRHVQFADFDNDNDMDLFLSGYNNGSGVTLLYKNNGSGNFSATNNQPFQNDYSDNIYIKDIDGDNDLDIVLLNIISNSNHQIKIYKNDSTAGFIIANNYSFSTPGFNPLRITLADVDRDNVLDIIVGGEIQIGNDLEFFTEILLNNGSGQFTPVNKTFFPGMAYLEILKTADINGDGYDDIFMNGKSISGYLSAKVFINNSSGLGFSTTDNNKKRIKIYPNPATNQITFEFTGKTKGNGQITIYDIFGKEIITRPVTGSKSITINISTLSCGMYFYKVQVSNGEISSGKFVKQ